MSTATAAANVFDYATGAAIEGISVCNTANDACSLSNAEGVAEFTYVPGDDITVTFDGDIYFGSMLNAQLTPNEDETPNQISILLVQKAAAELVVASPPEPVDFSNTALGHIIVWSTTNSGTFLSGSAFDVEPASGKGPFYFAQGNILTNLTAGSVYDADATQTTSNGVAQFVELEPGQYTMNITHEGRTCTAGYGIPSGDNALTFTIEADRISYILLTCDGDEPFQTAVNLTDFATTAAIEGAIVCNEELGLCAETDAQGNTNVPYAQNADNTLTFTKENYFSARIGYTATEVLDDNFITGINQVSATLIERDQVEVIVPQAPGAPMGDDTKAGIVATVFDRTGGTVAGASVSLDPQSGVGPFYFADGN